MSRHVTFERLHNFRDLGGYPTADGRRVRLGRLYRSDSLGKLGGADWDRFLELGIGTVIDLRYPWEVDRWGRVPDGPEYHNLSIEHRPYDQAALGPEVDPVDYLAERFAEVTADGVAEIRQALEVIAAADEPVVFHCASGKDRTGIVAALVLSLLGVEEDTVVEDFALTGLATDRLVADWRAAHDGRSPRWPAYGTAPADLMRRFLRDLGPVEDYAKRLGFDPEPLRGRYVDSATSV
ncbi:tyrosine-protein phosphatase [Nonomuraea sediminis]|uniref:tyrosine-protein phosphatase n=1 Tax=Nonomuraea sediminis TaxID=2835864 RepID=UPI001BDCAFA5|nr:tyrosine-protein phosphatase [Nonomuraea sediminis]